jgi:hypothetical protein
MLEAPDVLAILDRLDRAGVVVWLDGGWGVDAWGDYPAEGLAGSGRVGGREVRCVTAELQIRHYLGYPLGETDRHDLALLGERFGVALPPGTR